MKSSKRKLSPGILLICAIILLIAAGGTRNVYRQNMSSMENQLNSVGKYGTTVPVSVLGFSANKSDFRLRYSGTLRQEPEEMSWNDTVKLKTEIEAKLNNTSTNDDSFSRVLKKPCFNKLTLDFIGVFA